MARGDGIVIVGGGAGGVELASALHRAGYVVAVLDVSAEALRALPDGVAASQHVGDALDPEVLRGVIAGTATCIVATTGRDETNAVAALLAVRALGVSHAVARVRDPARARSLQALGIDTTWPAPAEAAAVLRSIERVIQR